MFKEILGEAFPIIEKIAPMIATSIGSPIAGAATNAAISLLNNAFGSSKDSIAQLGTLITNHPEVESKLAEVEGIFKNMSLVPMPSDIEINVKVKWPVQQNQMT